MSQWTHFLGVVRFESMYNIWPEPRDKSKLVSAEADAIHDIFQRGNIPYGSEGPLQVDTIITERGPTVVITGDLRDFGAGDLACVVLWLNDRCAQIKQTADLFIRDGFVTCDVESDKNIFFITMRNDSDAFRFVSCDEEK